MATLSIPHSFVPGTPALASEVNANFQAVVSWTQGQISTDNFGILGARSVALPNAPTFAILSLQQPSSNIALNISNAGTESAIVVNQSGALAGGKASILINSPSNQSTSGAAELLMDLNTNASIPAILVKHGTVETMSLSRTQLNLFASAIQATSAGVISATTVNLTTANATTVGATDVNTTNLTATGLLDLTAPSSDAIVAKVKGRSSDNNAIVQFKSNDDATVYASATSSPSGLTFNLPDTADSYTFQVNGVTKAVVNNSGIDAQYLYGLLPVTVKAATLVASPSGSWSDSRNSFGSFSETRSNTVSTGTLTLTQPTFISGYIVSGTVSWSGTASQLVRNPSIILRVGTRNVSFKTDTSLTGSSGSLNFGTIIHENDAGGVLPAGTYTYSLILQWTYGAFGPGSASTNITFSNISTQIYTA